MESLIIEIENRAFIVHFENDEYLTIKTNWYGSVAEICVFDDGVWEYQSSKSSDTTNDLEKARIWFDFIFCWRGCWEDRIYFKEEEFWHGEIMIIPSIWKKIEDVLKKKIKLDNPDYEFFDD